MNKQEFLEKLKKGLSGLPQEDIDERLIFYSEMIDDRMEEGFLEEDAVAQIGNVDEIISQIITEFSSIKRVKQKIMTKRKIKVWEIVFLVLGSPIWLALIISAFAIVLSLYASLWALVVSLWAAFASFVACSLAGILLGIVYVFAGKMSVGLFVISASSVLAGLAIFTFYVCKIITKLAVILTKKISIMIKTGFLNKEKIL